MSSLVFKYRDTAE